jgi:hypothetical protein
MAEIADYFPLAVIDQEKVQIPLNTNYRVDLTVDYEAQMILIVFAGAKNGARAGRTGSKAA